MNKRQAKKAQKKNTTTYEWYADQMRKLNKTPLGKEAWNLYMKEDAATAKELQIGWDRSKSNMNILVESSDLLSNGKNLSQLRARANYMYMQGHLRENPAKMSDLDLVHNDKLMRDWDQMEARYQQLKYAREDAQSKGKSTFEFEGVTYAVMGTSVKTLMSQLFFGSN